MVQQWLAAAQLAQVGMDRLVGTLELIEGARVFCLQLSSLCASSICALMRVTRLVALSLYCWRAPCSLLMVRS